MLNPSGECKERQTVGGRGSTTSNHIESLISDHKDGPLTRWVPHALLRYRGDFSALNIEDPHVINGFFIPSPESHYKPLSEENG